MDARAARGAVSKHARVAVTKGMTVRFVQYCSMMRADDVALRMVSVEEAALAHLFACRNWKAQTLIVISVQNLGLTAFHSTQSVLIASVLHMAV